MIRLNPRCVYDSEFIHTKIDASKYVKASLHTHSKPNSHLKNTPLQVADLVEYCKDHNIRILAITNHEMEKIDRTNPFVTDQIFNWLPDFYDAENDGSALTFKDFPVTALKSKEFWAKDSQGNYVHVNGIGYNGEIECNRSFSVDYLTKEIKKHKGLVMENHPFSRFARGVLEPDLEKLIGDEKTRPDMLEVNSMNTAWLNTYYNRKVIKFGRKNEIPLVAGSDAHFPFHIEFGYILIDRESLDVKNSEVKGVLRDKIETRDYYNYFQPIPINYFFQWWITTQKKNLKARSF